MHMVPSGPYIWPPHNWYPIDCSHWANGPQPIRSPWTVFYGARFSRGINFMGIICPGDRKLGIKWVWDQMHRSPNPLQKCGWFRSKSCFIKTSPNPSHFQIFRRHWSLILDRPSCRLHKGGGVIHKSHLQNKSNKFDRNWRSSCGCPNYSSIYLFLSFLHRKYLMRVP